MKRGGYHILHSTSIFVHFDVMQQNACYYLIKQESGLTPAVGHVIRAGECVQNGVFSLAHISFLHGNLLSLKPFHMLQ